jgi:hypothetical protein
MQKKITITILLIIIIALGLLFGCTEQVPVCGDGICEEIESDPSSPFYCPQDCENGGICLQTVEKEIDNFVMALEDSTNNYRNGYVDFKPVYNNCYDEAQSTLMIEDIRDNSRRCSSICGLNVDSCFVMTFHSNEIVNGYLQKCIQIPVYTTFGNSESCSTVGLEDRVVINPTTERLAIKSGDYLFLNVAPSGQVYPEICIYYKDFK